MDADGKDLYESCMSVPGPIPVFNLFGETAAFPDVIHCERIWDRARLHDWAISPHRHREMMQVFAMRQGEAQVMLDGDVARLHDGQFLFVPALVVHGFRFRKGSEGMVLSFPLSVAAGLQAASAEIGRHLSRPFFGALDEGLLTLIGQLSDAFAGHGAYRGPLLAALSHALLTALCELDRAASAETVGGSPQRLQRLAALVAAHMAEGWRPGDYARALAITPGHLNRLCREAAGVSASRHIEGLVMAEACRLLAFTQLPVAEIGYRLGFHDPAHFSRRFRLLGGTTPSAYRRPFMTVA